MNSARVLDGSQLWSIKGQTHKWRQRSTQTNLTAAWFLWTNQNALIRKATNQFVSFCVDNRLLQMAIFTSLSKWGKDPLDSFPIKINKLLHNLPSLLYNRRMTLLNCWAEFGWLCSLCYNYLWWLSHTVPRGNQSCTCIQNHTAWSNMFPRFGTAKGRMDAEINCKICTALSDWWGNLVVDYILKIESLSKDNIWKYNLAHI